MPSLQARADALAAEHEANAKRLAELFNIPRVSEREAANSTAPDVETEKAPGTQVNIVDNAANQTL